jgi:hypothetical protein
VDLSVADDRAGVDPAERRLREALRELVEAYSQALELDLPVLPIVVEELGAAGVELPAALTMF